MNNNIKQYIIFLVVLFCSSATYSAPKTPLWGPMDVPIENTKTSKDKIVASSPAQEITKERKPKTEENNLAKVIEKPEATIAIIDQRPTICELLNDQPNLATTTLDDSLFLQAIQIAYNNVDPSYKVFLENIEAVDALYQKFRKQYLRANCATLLP